MLKKSVNIWRQLIIVHHIPARSKLNETQYLLANSNPSHFRLKISSWSNSTPATNPSHPFVPENGYVIFTANALLDNVDSCCMRLCYSQLIDIQLKNVLATQWHHTQHGTIGCRERKATKCHQKKWDHMTCSHILRFCLIYLDISVVKHSCDRINQALFVVSRFDVIYFCFLGYPISTLSLHIFFGLDFAKPRRNYMAAKNHRLWSLVMAEILPTSHKVACAVYACWFRFLHDVHTFQRWLQFFPSSITQCEKNIFFIF